MQCEEAAARTLGSEQFSLFRVALQGNIWSRPGWVQMDDLRKRLEDLRELRDLVRQLV